MTATKLWANSGDSHLVEPFDLFDDAASRRIRIGAFQEPFPHVPPPPVDGQELPTPS